MATSVETRKESLTVSWIRGVPQEVKVRDHRLLPDRLDSEMRRRLQRVLEGCTVHQSLAHPPAISVELR
jgi:hypothetical protein